MKFRYVLVILAGLLFAAIVVTVSTVARYGPNHYGFLGNAQPSKVSLQPDPIGWVGREERFYVLHKDAGTVAKEAIDELTPIGWRHTTDSSLTFRRGQYESITIARANASNDLGLVPSDRRSEYTIVTVIDPRMPPAFRQRIARWTRHPFRRLLHRFV